MKHSLTHFNEKPFVFLSRNMLISNVLLIDNFIKHYQTKFTMNLVMNENFLNKRPFILPALEVEHEHSYSFNNSNRRWKRHREVKFGPEL